MSDNLVGKLLVATPLLHDPNFVRSVVLLCQQNDDGYLGLILNRPLEDTVGEHLPEWEHLVSAPAQIFEGGPVQREVALALGRRTDGGEDSDDAGGWTAIGGELGLLDLRGTPSELWGAIEQLRIFSGYSGWGAGQLEGELREEAWFVIDAEPGDPFAEDSAGLWQRVLRRQPGNLAMFATFPPDPALN